MPKEEKSYASPLMQLAVDMLKADRNASYQDIAAAAEKKGLKMAPIVFGRARLALGMAKPRKGKAAKRAAGGALGGRGPGRPPGRSVGAGRGRGQGPTGANAGPAATSGLGGVIEHVRGLEREVADLRDRLAKIAQLATR